METQPSKKPRRSRWLIGCGLFVWSGLFLAILAVTIPSYRPGFSAQAADWLRHIVGDAAVARLETVVFEAQDLLRNQKYRLSGQQPSAPWAAIPSPGGAGTPAKAKTIQLTPGPLAGTLGPSTKTQNLKTPALPSATSSPPAGPTPTPGPWALPQVTALGDLEGEGQWSTYIQDRSGRVVAVRTFLQPDPGRPFTIAAVVAMDLANTRLHFVLGSQEPVSPVKMVRPGRIPSDDLKPGVLLAAFNGGFKANQGQFGAFVEHVTVLPPRPGLGVIAIYEDGQVRMGAWGTDFTSSAGMQSWRQNGPLIIQGGQINPHTADLDPGSWGYAVGGKTATWRSGIGLTADRRTLLYAAAPDITLPALALALQAAGADQALQMDINDYWVHFDAITETDGVLHAEGLLDEMKLLDDQRYLKTSIRDFFYLTDAP